MTRAWVNRLSNAALIAASAPALVLLLMGAGISFTMSNRDPFPSAENAAVYAIFAGPIVATGVAFLSRAVGLGLLAISLLVGLHILHVTQCLGLGSDCSPFSFYYIGWPYAAVLCLTLASLGLRIWARRTPQISSEAQVLIAKDARYATLRHILLVVVGLWILDLVCALWTGRSTVFGLV